MPIDAAIESVLKRDRIVVIGALSMVVVVSWAYVLAGAGMDMSAFEMTRMISGDAGMVMTPAVWGIGYASLMFFMWWVMMIAMMLPSAAPMVLCLRL